MLITEQRGAVLLLTLDRPEKRNALHPDLIAKVDCHAGRSRRKL